MELKIEYRNPTELIAAEYNPRKATDKENSDIDDSLKRFGVVDPVIVNQHPDRKDIIVGGHRRTKRHLYLWENSEEYKTKYKYEIPVVYVNLDLEKERELNIRLNKNTGQFDNELLSEFFKESELIDWGFDAGELDFLNDPEELPGEEEFEEELPEKAITVLGDLYELHSLDTGIVHRIQCGDSTDSDVVGNLMNGQLAKLGFNDPPYGMKKENEGVINDNLNFEKLLSFNRIWIPLQFSHLHKNGSFYCWGTDEPLMDMYSEIIKPYIKDQKATFRNLITWDKGNGQGQNSENTRSYAIADEKCLFIMMGVQGFCNNSDNYFEGWEPLRLYLLNERNRCGWSVPEMKRIAGHSDLHRDHWTSKSQWNLVPEYVYEKFQKWALENGVNAFKREYEDIKREYYSTRAYFNNTHDNFNNVWHFKRDTQNQTHATPKPLDLVSRALKSSSQEKNIVLDFFLGSGTTLIACEQLERVCYGQELDEKYMDVIVKRWVKFMEDNNRGYKVFLNGEETKSFNIN